MRPKKAPRTCDFCDRTFTRTEHLVRHRRTHTAERPFSCPVCHASFPRLDVQQKHMKRSHPGSTQDGDLDDVAMSAAPPKPRSKVACDSCRKRKLRCTGESPCEHCQTSNQSCTFSDRSKRRSIAAESNFNPDMKMPSAIADGKSNGFDADLTDDSAFLSMNVQPLTPSNFQSGQSGSMTSWMNQVPTSGPSADRLETGEGTYEAHGPMDLDQPMPFYDGSDGQPEMFGFENMWPPDDFDPSFWLDGMNFNFADDLSGTYGSVGSLPDQAAEEQPPSELHAVLNAYPQSQKAMAMVQYYYGQISQPPSPGKARSRHDWSTAPLKFQVYDEEVMDLFISIARHHMTPVFPILDIFSAGEPKRELTLAYAAVGGLFCNIPGRFKIVSSMYNDARRMLLDPTYQQKSRTVQHQLDSIKSYILLEIYGLCSGDKRSYEFVEAFHAKMLRVADEYKQASGQGRYPSIDLAQNKKALSKSLYVLECYRVMLLLRPPTSKIQSDLDMRIYDDPSSSTAESHKHLEPLFSTCNSTSKSARHQDDIITLSSITILAWPVLPRGSSVSPSSSLWKPEFIELALDKWTKTISNVNAYSTLLLYHMLHISLHANMGFIQRFAHSPAESPVRAKSGVACRSLEQWQQSSHYEVAKWHALCILRRVKDPTSSIANSTVVNAEDTISAEPPHLPYCVYFAGLILWCGAFVSAEEKASNVFALNVSSQLLSAMRVRVAELLDGILQGLKDVLGSSHAH